MSIIKLDYDEKEHFLSFPNKLNVIKSIIDLDIVYINVYVSKGGNHHVLIHLLNEFNDLEVLCLQQILGSDWVRGAFNLRRVRAGQKNWNILFNEHLEVNK